MDDEGDVVAQVQLIEQPIEVLTMFNERVRPWASVVELVGVALADQIRCDTTSLARNVGDNVAPQVGRCWIAMQEDHWVAGTDIVVRHLFAVNGLVLLAQHFDAH